MSEYPKCCANGVCDCFHENPVKKTAEWSESVRDRLDDYANDHDVDEKLADLLWDAAAEIERLWAELKL